MAYSTIDEVQIAVGGSRNLVELSDLEEAGVINTGVVDAAIAEADGQIDSYVGHRKFVPLANPSQVIIAMSARWAARVLRRNRYKGQPMIDDQEAEKIDIAWLQGVASGVISLGVEPDPDKASIVIDKAGARPSTLSVSRFRMKGFI